MTPGDSSDGWNRRDTTAQRKQSMQKNNGIEEPAES
jgi:hypothetical protein